MIRKNINIPDESIVDRIDESYDLLDAHRTDGLEQAKKMTEIKNKTLAFEAERLKNKYGPNHVLINNISKQILINKEYLKKIEVEMKRKAE